MIDPEYVPLMYAGITLFFTFRRNRVAYIFAIAAALSLAYAPASR